MVDGGLERKAKKRERTFVADVALRTMRKVTCEGKESEEESIGCKKKCALLGGTLWLFKCILYVWAYMYHEN